MYGWPTYVLGSTPDPKRRRKRATMSDSHGCGIGPDGFAGGAGFSRAVAGVFAAAGVVTDGFGAGGTDVLSGCAAPAPDGAGFPVASLIASSALTPAASLPRL